MVEEAEEVVDPRAVPKLLSKNTNTRESLLLEVRKMFWLLAMAHLVNLSMVKNVYPLVKVMPKWNIVFGIHSDQSLLLPF